MNYHANLADLVDDPLTMILFNMQPYHRSFDEAGKVWTWDAGGFGNWQRPPGAQNR